MEVVVLAAHVPPFRIERADRAALMETGPHAAPVRHDQLAVPAGLVADRRRERPGGGIVQEADDVRRPVDHAFLVPVDERRGLAVHRRGPVDVGRPRTVGIERLPGAVGTPIVVAGNRRSRAGLIRRRRESVGFVFADERRLLRACEQGAIDRMVGKGERRLTTAGRHGQRIVSVDQAVDQTDPSSPAVGDERTRDIAVVDRHTRRGVRSRDPHQGVTARHQFGKRRQDLDAHDLAPSLSHREHAVEDGE